MSADPRRKADLASIHIGRKALGWDDSTYRSILASVCGAASSADLDQAGRDRLLTHMAKCGWSRGGRPGAGGTNAKRKPLTPPQKKMWSLWMQLGDAGLIEHRTMRALLAFVHRQTGVDQLDWLNGEQEDLVIESLKSWVARGGAHGA